MQHLQLKSALTQAATHAGGRQLRDAAVAAAPSSMAGAPGPSAGKPPADILFTITGSRAVLTADTLTVSGVAPVALHTTSGQGAGATPVGARLSCVDTSWVYSGSGVSHEVHLFTCCQEL